MYPVDYVPGLVCPRRPLAAPVLVPKGIVTALATHLPGPADVDAAPQGTKAAVRVGLV